MSAISGTGDPTASGTGSPTHPGTRDPETGGKVRVIFDWLARMTAMLYL